MEPQLNCPYCRKTISLSDYFCPNCGKKLKDKPLPITITRQAMIYLLSFFIPPLGLWPAVKYLKQEDKKSKIIGLIVLFLTILSTTITVWMTLGFINAFNKFSGASLFTQ